MRPTELLARLRDRARATPGELGLLALLGAAVLAGGAVVQVRTRAVPAPPIERRLAAEAAPAPSPALIVVHVAGQVASPGVYELPQGSRVRDAVGAAGGAAAGADLSALNLAALVEDGQKIVVPRPGESPRGEAPSGGDAGRGPPPRVNLNTASPEELERLPGVGEVLAGRIVERRRRGGFSSIRQLLEIEGVGPKKYEALKDLVTV